MFDYSKLLPANIISSLFRGIPKSIYHFLVLMQRHKWMIMLMCTLCAVATFFLTRDEKGNRRRTIHYFWVMQKDRSDSAFTTLKSWNKYLVEWERNKAYQPEDSLKQLPLVSVEVQEGQFSFTKHFSSKSQQALKKRFSQDSTELASFLSTHVPSSLQLQIGNDSGYQRHSRRIFMIATAIFVTAWICILVIMILDRLTFSHAKIKSLEEHFLGALINVEFYSHEQYKFFAYELHHRIADSTKIILLTHGTNKQEAMRLAAAHAPMEKVLLLDCDPWKGSAEQKEWLDSFNEQTVITDKIQKTPEGFDLLQTDVPQSAQWEILHQHAAQVDSWMDRLTELYQTIYINPPRMTKYADGLFWLRYNPWIVFVVDKGSMYWYGVLKLHKRLKDYDARIFGILLINDPDAYHFTTLIEKKTTKDGN